MKVLNRVAKVCIGCYMLILCMILVIIPNLPLLGILLLCKHVEAYLYAHLYNASIIRHYNFLKLSSGVHTNRRTTLVIVDGSVRLPQLKELIVKSLLDAHTVTGELCFPHLTKKYVGGCFNNYWLEEDTFSLSDHVTAWGEENVYTKTELQQILVRLKEEAFDSSLSPWSCTLIPLESNKTALALRCHPALRDLELLGSLLTGHVVCDHDHWSRDSIIFEGGVVKTIYQLSLFMWNISEVVFSSFSNSNSNNMDNKNNDSNKATHRQCTATCGLSVEKGRKVLMWSRPMEARVLEEIGRNLKVGTTDLLLGCVSCIVDEMETLRDDECPLSIADTDTVTRRSRSASFTFKSGVQDPISVINKSKHKLYEIGESGKFLTPLLVEKMANLFLPIRVAKYVGERMREEVKVNINNVLAERRREDATSGLPVDMVSVWGEESQSRGMDICVTNTMGKLVVATDAYHTQQKTSQQLFHHFDDVVKKLAAQTGVFAHYYQ